MTMFVGRASETASWLLRDVAIREALLSAPDVASPLERSARDVRLSLGDSAHEQAMPVPLGVAAVEPLCAEGAIPEVAAEDLDVDVVRRGVRGNGAVIVRGLLDDDAVSRLREVGRLAVEASRHPGRSMFYDPIDATWTSRDRSGLRRFVELSGGVLLADSPVGLEVLLEEYERCGVLDVIRGYVGDTVLLSGAKATLRSIAPSVSADLGWHQDGAFLGPDLGALNVWVALTDCGVDAPTMMMLPRRLDEIVPVGGDDAAFEWSVGVGAVEAASKGCDPVVLEFSAGDAILFDEMNLHRTFTAPSMSSTRLAIESWFFAAERMPDGWAALAV